MVDNFTHLERLLERDLLDRDLERERLRLRDLCRERERLRDRERDPELS